uniref:Uncharacterized protein n=1 Tax=Arundo donax TaxID=35708 RepID=A0A0A8XY71_ARUDO
MMVKNSVGRTTYSPKPRCRYIDLHLC